MVSINSHKEVFCDELTPDMHKCEFFSLLANSGVCGDCPLYKASEEVIEILFDCGVNDLLDEE